MSETARLLSFANCGFAYETIDGMRDDIRAVLAELTALRARVAELEAERAQVGFQAYEAVVGKATDEPDPNGTIYANRNWWRTQCDELNEQLADRDTRIAQVLARCEELRADGLKPDADAYELGVEWAARQVRALLVPQEGQRG